MNKICRFFASALALLLLSACSAPDEFEPVQIAADESGLLPGETAAIDGQDQTAVKAKPMLEIGRGLSLMSMNRYSGAFVEDGSDEIVDGVLAITVRNDGQNAIQYAHIILTQGEETYEFDITTLPVGASAQLLELSRKAAPDNAEGVKGEVSQYAVFNAEPSMHSDIFALEAKDNSITVTNVSGKDIAGQIYVYYKIAYGDLYMGGITYRVGIEGLQAGASMTCYAGHYQADYSRLMFVDYAK